MRVGIIIYSDDSETLWNGFRFGNFALAMGDEVKAFLVGRGVEYGSADTDKFAVSEQLQAFHSGGGKVFICGTCLNIHQLPAPENFTVASLKDLHEIVAQADRLVTF